MPGNARSRRGAACTCQTKNLFIARKNQDFARIGRGNGKEVFVTGRYEAWTDRVATRFICLFRDISEFSAEYFVASDFNCNTHTELCAKQSVIMQEMVSTNCVFLPFPVLFLFSIALRESIRTLLD